jgi:hypothetical protein
MTTDESNRGGFRGAELNPAHTVPLAHAIGGFLVNFGSIELSADAWIHALATDSIAAEELHKLNLGKKLHAIQRFLDAGRLPAAFADDARRAWKDVARLSELRNQVAHNPVFFGWRGEKQEGPPDFSGVPDRRKGIKREGPTPGLIPLSEIQAAQNESATLAQQLLSLADRVSAADAWPPEDPMPRKPSNER